MIDYTNTLKLKVDQQIRIIESGEKNKLKQTLTISRMLEDVFGQLKEFISNYSFKNEDEEILFFKKIKPNIFSNLLYCRKVCDIEKRPKGTTEEMKRYINYELDQIQQYNFNHLDFYTYLLHDETNLDREYFLREFNGCNSRNLGSFYFERDPIFSTNGDFMVAKILANDMLQFYLNEELNMVSKQHYLLDHSNAMPDSTPRWTDKKNALISVLYCFDEMNSIENGNIPLSRLAAHFENAFDIKLGNITRAFNEMKLKANPTEYIDAMKEALLRRINETENKHISRKLSINR